jgi:hypothetical protein
VQQNAKNTIDASKSFSSTITSYARATKRSWYFARIEDFSSRASHLAKLTNADIVSVASIVEEKDVPGWLSFIASNETEAMYKEAIEFEGITHTTAAELVNMTPQMIFGFNPETLETYAESGPGPFLPSFHTSPLLPIGVAATNLNILSIPRCQTNFWSAVSTNLPSLTFANNIVVSFLTGEFTFQLESQLVQPIFEDIDNGKRNREDLKMVGVVLLTLNMLPKDVKGIPLVLSSSCSEDVFTYQIDGHAVVPIGAGDLHDTTYDAMEVTSPFALLSTAIRALFPKILASRNSASASACTQPKNSKSPFTRTRRFSSLLESLPFLLSRV